MPARWQQWIPFRIDAFKSSPAVQAMHPAARAGYIYLLLAAWQTDDCTVSADPLDLAENSGLGDELWALHGPRILRKFITVTERSPSINGTVTVQKLRNEPEYEEWKEAKRVYDSRKNAAKTTNTERSPHKNSTVTDTVSATVTERSPIRSADTRTGTLTGTETEELPPLPPALSRPINPETSDGSELAAANWLCAEANVPLSMGARQQVALSLRCVANEGGTMETASQFMLQAVTAARERGEKINRFWFEEEQYKPKIVPSGVSTEGLEDGV